MMPPEKRKLFLLHAQRKGFQRKVDMARERVREWLGHVSNPYVAFSTGKDSTCILSLVREQRAETPAVYFDADCAYPESVSLLGQITNLIKFLTDEPFLDSLVRLGLRTPFDDTMQTLVYGPVKRLMAQYEFDGMCYGLRAEEASGRRKHALSRGAVFWHKRDSVWACMPVWDWVYQDVWAYIVTNSLSYCGVYDKLWDLPIINQRICYWAAGPPRQWGRFSWLKQHYPELFNRLAEMLPEVREYL